VGEGVIVAHAQIIVRSVVIVPLQAFEYTLHWFWRLQEVKMCGIGVLFLALT
jgi:hypothetical protein